MTHLVGGYLAAGFAALLHELGRDFYTLDFATADALNTTAWVQTANQHLGLTGDEAEWLTGDQAAEYHYSISKVGRSRGWRVGVSGGREVEGVDGVGASVLCIIYIWLCMI